MSERLTAEQERMARRMFLPSVLGNEPGVQARLIYEIDALREELKAARASNLELRALNVAGKTIGDWHDLEARLETAREALRDANVVLDAPAGRMRLAIPNRNRTELQKAAVGVCEIVTAALAKIGDAHD